MRSERTARWVMVVAALAAATLGVRGAEPPPVEIAKSPDGNVVVVHRRSGLPGSSARRITLLDAKTRQPIRELESPAADETGSGNFLVNSLGPNSSVGKFSPDGSVFALLAWVDSSGFEGPGAMLNRMQTPEEKAASVIVCGTWGVVGFWSVDSGKLLHCVGVERRGHRLEFVDDGLLVATWGGRNSVAPLAPLRNLAVSRPGMDAHPSPLEQMKEKLKKLSDHGVVRREPESGNPVTLIDVLSGTAAASFVGRTPKEPAPEPNLLAVRLQAGSRCLRLSYRDKTHDLHDILDGSACGPPLAAGPDWRLRIDELSGEDAGRAYAAVGRFAGGPTAELAQLGRLVKPVAELAKGEVSRLTAELDAADFDAREAAARKLEVLGAPARTALREVLAGKPSLELRRRTEALLEALDRRPLAGTSEERLALRAVTAFGLAGTDEARTQLRKLADGAPWALVTRHARAALDRLEKEGGR